MSVSRRSEKPDALVQANRRAWWMRQLRHWHWISGALSLVGTLLFAITGITLNHASLITSKPTVVDREATLPGGLKDLIAAKPPTEKAPLPEAVRAWVHKELAVDAANLVTEWSGDEIYISQPLPGGDAWLNIERATGGVRYERTDRGWIAYLNDLHKGRNTGLAWSVFIDVFAAACIMFSVTGLLLLQMYSGQRPTTWPMVGAGLALPILLAILFIHQ